MATYLSVGSYPLMARYYPSYSWHIVRSALPKVHQRHLNPWVPALGMSSCKGD
jgi:hypothetical protein